MSDLLHVSFLAHPFLEGCLFLQALNDFIDRKLQASPIKSLIVYPEGKHMRQFKMAIVPNSAKKCLICRPNARGWLICELTCIRCPHLTEHKPTKAMSQLSLLMPKLCLFHVPNCHGSSCVAVSQAFIHPI